jgi:hypothetical protein
MQGRSKRAPEIFEKCILLQMSDTSLHRLLYVSAAVAKMSVVDLEKVLADSRARNREAAVTGLLLYSDGDFMQMLEGPRGHVLETYSRIERNPLHRGQIVLINSEANERLFAEWSMAYSQATWNQLSDVQAACRKSPADALAVLRGFVHDHWRFHFGRAEGQPSADRPPSAG